jgi:cell division protein FtsI (penicillin-binding protein 3)
MAEKRSIKEMGHGIGKMLYVFYLLCLVLALAVIVKIIYLQYCFKPGQEYLDVLTPTSEKVNLSPTRGKILARDGRIFATSTATYDIIMDATVRKEEFRKDTLKGKEHEQEWLDKARLLSDDLSTVFPEKTASEYYRQIVSDRRDGNSYRVLGKRVDYRTLQKIKSFPLFEEGQNKGGIITKKHEVRRYPYGKLARRTIGFIRSNTEASKNNLIGLEGRFDYALHGKDGYEYIKKSDGGGRIQDLDSLYLSPVDGDDIRTTLDVDFQDIADRALRGQIDTNQRIEGGCLVVMEVKTGAIRAMVNLRRDPDTGITEESTNYAVGRAGEPGSIFKLATLMSLMNDGHVKSLYETVPANDGKGIGVTRETGKEDRHMGDYVREFHSENVPIIYGLQVSSNYLFSYLVTHNYGKDPQKFIDNLYSFKLGQAFDFDLDGMASPVLPSPGSPSWSRSSLATVAYGYSVAETPLHILTFYNAIANKGKMMKPYLVESIEKGGVVKEKRGPSILNAAVCSRQTADTLTAGLVHVVKAGTGSRVRGAKCQVAGKTGTAQIVLDQFDSKTAAGRYTDESGRKKNQATFVCFFPAENPQYSAICTVYSVLSPESFYGGTIPAKAIREVVDGIYAIDPYWRQELEPSGTLPDMVPPAEASAEEGMVPSLKGLGLRDAMQAIENNGLKCSYSGVGHVASQSPEAGKKLKKGQTVTIKLK